MVDPNSFTGSDKPLLTRTEDIHNDRRRLHWLLPNGSRHVVTIPMAEDSEEHRQRIADAIAADRHARIRHGRIVPEK